MSAVTYDDLMYELTWILTNLTSTESEKIINYLTTDNYVIGFLNEMLKHPQEKIREQAIW